MREPPRPWWALLSLVPFGWLAWAGLLYAGVRARMPGLYVLAAVFLATTVAGFALAGGEDDSTREDVAGTIIVVGWIGGLGASLGVAPAWQRRMRSRRLVAERSLESREEAREIAIDRPELARELGVGRPDLPGADHAGLVDINSAPVAVLARLPGIDDATAHQIARVREEVDGFSSIADMGAVLDLPADTVEDLRERVVFVPR